MNDSVTPWQSLADVRRACQGLPDADAVSVAAAQERQDALLKPPGSLGRLEDIVTWLAGWQKTSRPICGTPYFLIFAASHGVAFDHPVSAYPAEVTAQMIASYQAGGAAINQLCDYHNAPLQVIAIDVDQPTADMTAGPAMTAQACLAALNVGAAAVRKLPACDVLGLGEMGIGNTTVAAALCAALWGGKAQDWVGPGTGVTGDRLAAKQQVMTKALARHQAVRDPLMNLCALGGREIAAMVGALLAARQRSIPVLLDGFVVAAAASVFYHMATGETAGGTALDHARAAHVSAEPGHKRALARLGMTPWLDLGMRLGEASGAAVAIGLIRASLACYDGMATFQQAGVASKRDSSS